jgi:hypothetical protein
MTSGTVLTAIYILFYISLTTSKKKTKPIAVFYDKEWAWRLHASSVCFQTCVVVIVILLLHPSSPYPSFFLAVLGFELRASHFTTVLLEAFLQCVTCVLND